MGYFNFMLERLDEWQRSLGFELIKISDAHSVPVYDEDGARVRACDPSPILAITREAVRRARLDPLYAISPKAAIKKHTAEVVAQIKREAAAGAKPEAETAEGNRKRKRRRKRR
jgi:hypothetical protein